MNRLRLGAVLALAATLVLCAHAPRVFAAAEVHRFNLVIAGIPTKVDGGDLNRQIEDFNRAKLDPIGREGLSAIRFAWLFDVQFHYFVRENVAVNLGVGQLKSNTSREYLPGILQDIRIRGEVLSVPVHVGGDLYFRPYNQGDFRARAYVGAGFMSMVDNKALVEQVETNTDTLTTLGGSTRSVGVGDSPGYYVETGAHLFFAARYSVMLGAVYRSAKIRGMVDRVTREPLLRPDGKPYTLDLSGAGVKMAILIGF